MEHKDLIREFNEIQNLLAVQRIHLARERRKQQIHNYELYQAQNPQGTKTSIKKIRFELEDEILDIISDGDLEEIKNRINKGLNPNVSNGDGVTPLHQSIIEGNLEIAKLLIEKGANINSTDMDGWTPLHIAAACGQKDVVTFLIHEGANLTAMNTDNEMPFEKSDNKKTLIILEEAMVSQNITVDQINTVHNKLHTSLKEDIKTMIELGYDLNMVVTPDGATMLHVAVANSYNDLVEYLLENGASAETPDKEGWTPIHVATYWGNERGFQLLINLKNINLHAETNIGERIYDLCQDITFAQYMETILTGREKLNAVNGKEQTWRSNTLPEDDTDNITEDTETVENRRNSMDDLPAINPLLNPKVQEMVSDKRHSLKGIKRTLSQESISKKDHMKVKNKMELQSNLTKRRRSKGKAPQPPLTQTQNIKSEVYDTTLSAMHANEVHYSDKKNFEENEIKYSFKETKTSPHETIVKKKGCCIS